MGNPVYILAGQSNATAMQDEFETALQAAHGGGTYHTGTVAVGGAPLTWQRSKDDWMNDTELRQELYDTISGILEADPEAYLAGIVWVQGEADTYQTAHADEYAQALQDLIQDIRDNLAQDFPDRDPLQDGFDFIISGLSQNAPDANTRENWDAIREQQIALAESSADIQFINPDEIAIINGFSNDAMFEDGLHYSNTFQDTLMDALVANLIDQTTDIDFIDNSGINYFLGRGTDTIIYGATDKERIYGTDGDDVLVGGAGWNVFVGGAGNDIFVFTDEDRRWGERILDFEDNKDKIRIDTETIMSFDDLYIFEHDTLDGTVVNYGSGSFILMGVDISLISANDFDFM